MTRLPNWNGHLTAAAVGAAAILVSPPAFTTNAAGANYFLKGEITYEGHALGESPDVTVTPFTREFEVWVEDCAWTVRMTLIGNPGLRYFLSSFDGTNTVYVARTTEQAHDRMQKALQTGSGASKAQRLLPSCTVEIARAPRSISSDGGAHVWLALASGCYFSALRNGKALEINPVPGQSAPPFTRREVPCRYHLSSTPPYLPTDLEYFWTNRAFVGPDGVVLSQELPTPFRAGFTATHLRSSQFTNLNGLSFPTEFEIREFLPLPWATNKGDFRCTLQVRGVVREISINPPSPPDELSGEVFHVIDLRLPNAPMYCVTNGVFPASTSKTLAAAKREALLRHNAATGGGEQVRRRQGLGVWILGAVFLCPLIFLVRLSRIAQPRQKPKR
jgi:hypothetical protein